MSSPPCGRLSGDGSGTICLPVLLDPLFCVCLAGPRTLAEVPALPVGGPRPGRGRRQRLDARRKAQGVALEQAARTRPSLHHRAVRDAAVEHAQEIVASAGR